MTHQVQDFDTAKRGYDAGGALRRDHGVVGGQAFTDAGDGNKVPAALIQFAFWAARKRS